MNVNMIYYHHSMQSMLEGTSYDKTLQRYFPENDKWGASVLFDENGDPDLFEICTLKDYSVNGAEWTHYANIQRNGGEWELNAQFMGEDENEMWVFGNYATFGWCVRSLAKSGIEGRKPIQIY